MHLEVIAKNGSPLSYTFFCREHIGAHGAHIKSDSSILDPTILGRLGDIRLFAKIPNHGGGGIFRKLCE
jgi:hypothetical protein